ncbi:MAG: hypothetical protein VYB96_06020, partial [Pseudomonadota bacterium]|nr:hypothetical protein [Pseudomonadota bacterium]
MACLIDEACFGGGTAKDWIILGLVDLRVWLIFAGTNFTTPLIPAGSCRSGFWLPHPAKGAV